MTLTTSTAPAAQGEGEAGAAKPAVDLDDTAAHWLRYLAELDRQIKTLEQAKADARRHIEAALGEHEVGQVDGKPAVRWTYVHSSRVDTKKLREQDPELVKACTVPTVTRRFTLIEDGDR